MSNPNEQRAPAQSSPLACIAEQLQCLEKVARGRGSPTCDHLAGRLAEVRRDLQRVIDHQPPAAVSEVTRQLIDRDRKGREKYGVTLDRRDLSVSDWLQHMAEELMDAAGYALAAKRESEQPAAAFSNDGTSESRFIASADAACTACGGSGHRDDQQPAAVDGAAQAMAEIGRLIATQDNRITDSPIFIVQQKRTYVSEPGYNEDRVQWVTDDDDHRVASGEDVERNERYFDEHQLEPSGWRRMHVHDVWEFVTACFTEQGCKDYIARDGHNLREPRIYAAGSYRNAEWRAVRSYLMALAGQQGGAK